jgi:hypothetical protein
MSLLKKDLDDASKSGTSSIPLHGVKHQKREEYKCLPKHY